MDCPACSRALESVSVGDLEVDVCREGCAGIWFDNFELDKVDEAHESAGAALLDYQPALEVEADKRAKHPCPRDGQIMMRHWFTAFREIEVDCCPACNGVWLDAGELVRVRMRSEEERTEQAETVFDTMFGAELGAMHASSAESRAQAERFARALRWICPSYWIPGKQQGGAF